MLVIPIWKRRLDKLRERWPDFHPLLVTPTCWHPDDERFGKGDAYFLIGGDKVPFRDYYEHIGVPITTLKERYPPK